MAFAICLQVGRAFFHFEFWVITVQHCLLYFTTAQHSGYAELTKTGLSLVVLPGIKKSCCALRELHKQQKYFSCCGVKCWMQTPFSPDWTSGNNDEGKIVTWSPFSPFCTLSFVSTSKTQEKNKSTSKMWLMRTLCIIYVGAAENGIKHISISSICDTNSCLQFQRAVSIHELSSPWSNRKTHGGVNSLHDSKHKILQNNLS